MNLKETLKNKGISSYRLSKESGVPQTTVTDILLGNSDLLNCSAITVYRLGQVLGMTSDEIIETVLQKEENDDESHEVFRSNTCHSLAKLGDLEFIKETLQKRRIQKAKKEGHVFDYLYLLGMIDYLCRINGLPFRPEFYELRKEKLNHQFLPPSFKAMSMVFPNDEWKKKVAPPIPEFLRFNIVEGDVKNVV